MNTEPPTGDDLQRMLVGMKQTVLDRAEERRPASRRHGRRAGIVIGVIALLSLGATGGGVALGMIPQPFSGSPAAISTPDPTEPVSPSTPAAAPVENAPVPVPTPTPTKAPFALDDPSTWTISGSEVGPVALGGTTEAESDDLEQAFQLLPATPSSCTAPGTWARDGSPTLLIAAENDRVTGVLIGAEGDSARTTTTGPTTAAGIGVGSSSDTLRAAYPSLHERVSTPDNSWSRWDVQLPDGLVSFQLGKGGASVDSIWVSPDQNLPTAVCDL
ncbi:hypothetical protein EDF64_11550 [Curtobacterium flaccumfaciens]|uniref:Uncharacterized protein n=2 Tax=Curtobacterium flaccumfaciens TaxID=2035 RepID=A0A4R6DBL3_9MICO|nr:hypothetical protein EDF64_11550 [Curtobacterium flaccumfaciens]